MIPLLGSWETLGWPDPAPAPGDVDAIRGLSSAYQERSDLAGDVRNHLAGLTDPGGAWTGAAARAFTARMDDQFPFLDRARNSYATASAALTTYAATLDELQQRALTLLHQALAADQRRRAGTTSQFSWSLGQQSLLTPDAQAAADQLTGHRHEHDTIAHEHAAAVRRCRDTLQDAAVQGMRNDTWSGMRRFVPSIARTIRDDAHVVSVAGNAAAVTMGGISVALTATGVGAPVAAFTASAAGVLDVVAMTATLTEAGAGGVVAASDVAYGGPVAEDTADAVLAGAMGTKNVTAWRQGKQAESTVKSATTAEGLARSQMAQAEQRYADAVAATQPELAAQAATERAAADASRRAAAAAGDTAEAEKTRIVWTDRGTDAASNAGGYLGAQVAGPESDGEDDKR